MLKTMVLSSADGSLVRVTPRDFLRYRTRGNVEKTTPFRKQDMQTLLDQHGHFILKDYVAALDPLGLECTECGHSFRELLTTLKSHYWLCPFCEKEKIRKQKEKEYKSKIRDIVGDEYQLIRYNSPTNVDILHRTCGKVHKYSIYKFMAGKRCPCRKGAIKMNDLKEIVKEVSGGRYAIIAAYPEDKKVDVLDTKNGTIYKGMKKGLVAQEFTRPTSSSLFELPGRANIKKKE